MKDCVFVLVPPDAPDFHQKVDELMAPYRFDMEVAPYEAQCWCIDSWAPCEVEDRVTARLGNRAEIEARVMQRAWSERQEARFRVLLQKEGMGTPKTKNRLSATEAQELALLREIISRLLEEAEIIWETKEWWGENPPDLRPDAACKLCGGSGVMTATENPDGKYDGYSLDFDFEVPDYDPEGDEAIRLDCIKPPELSCALEEQPEEFTLAAVLSLPVRLFRAVRAALRIGSPNSCEGCVGYAVRLRWGRDWKQYRASMLPVAWLDESPAFPHAIVTPDGKWHDLDVSGYDVTNTDQAWSESVAKFNQLMEEHASCYVAACRIRI